MSETPVSGNGSDVFAPSPADRVNDALITFAGCIANALEDICTYSVTIGQSFVPFDPDEDDDCDADDAVCSTAWVRVINAQLTGQQWSFGGGDGCAPELQLQLEVGVLRCVEIPEKGEAPTATDVLAASNQAMIDMLAISCAANACEAFDEITTGQWSPSGPSGGQYGGTWTFTAVI